MESNLQIGNRVNVIRSSDSFYNSVQWWPATGMTGTIEAIHKNGSVRVACDQLKNSSNDGKISKTFKKGECFFEIIG